MPEPIVTLSAESLRTDLRELVRRIVEELLNGLLDEEAGDLVGAGRYERTAGRETYRAGHNERKLATTSGEVTVRMPNESAPVPLTHRVPFRHDARNGERRQAWDSVSEVHGRVQAEGGAAVPRARQHLRRDRQGARGRSGERLGLGGEGGRLDGVPEGNPLKVAEENRRLRRGVERLRRENEILLKASAFFAGGQL